MSVSVTLPFWSTWIVASWVSSLIVVHIFFVLMNDFRVFFIRFAVLDLADPFVASNLERGFLQAQRLNVFIDQVLSFLGVF